MSYKVIVAKYNENMDWFNNISESAAQNYIVYDKGSSPIPDSFPKQQIFRRKNLGREVESFIFYILENYYNLPDYVIFLQGHPFDHADGCTPENIQQKIEELVGGHPKQSCSFYGDHRNMDNFPGMQIHKFINHILGEKNFEKCCFCPGCQYLTTRDDILSKPIEFYKNLQVMLINGEKDYNICHHVVRDFNPHALSGWEFERIMYEVLIHRGDLPAYMKSKRYLVTGGAGFIGSNLVDRLLEEGNNVIVIDNLCTGNEENLAAAREKYPAERLHFIKGDVKDKDVLYSAGTVDGVFHMAAMSKVLPSLDNIEMVDFCNDENVKGTISVLKYAATMLPREPIKVVYSASSTYYGSQPIPHKEDMLPDCQTPYAASKYCGEVYCKMFSLFRNVPTVRLRYFMVYGEREPCVGQYAIVTGIFAKNRAEGRPLEIHGDGEQTRDFVYVGDVCRACIMAMNRPDLTDETINVGTGEMISIKELANIISPNQVFVAGRKIDLRQTKCDTGKIEEIFGWRPQTRIKDWLLKLFVPENM
jgi:nucleoside-diphosphate-sugar epimerase